jgi:hypothetical protein
MLLMKRALDRQIHESQLADRGLLDVILDGRPTANNTINVEFLARFLTSLQNAATSVGQAMTGEPTRRGAIPADIRQATALSVAATFAGSFGLHITATEVAPSVDILEDEQTVLERSVSSILETVNAAVAGDNDVLQQKAASLGPRAFSGVRSLIQLLAGEEVTASIEWRSPSLQLTASLTPSQLSRAGESMAVTAVTQHDMVIVGRLVGASLVRGRFELETPNGVVLSGPVEPELVERMQNYFNQDCQATLRVTTVRSIPDGTESLSYTLLDLT